MSVPTAWLHIRSSATYHAEAYVTGTRAGLESLRDAIDQALAGDEGRVLVFASDGESYNVEVRCSSTVRGLGKPTYLDEIARDLMQMERNYLVQEDASYRKAVDAMMERAKAE